MKFEKVKIIGVAKDGKVKSGGSVVTKGDIRIFYGNGCKTKECHCSDGYSISIIMPRTSKGVVEVMKVIFDNYNEMKSQITK